jgi:putative endonuclease
MSKREVWIKGEALAKDYLIKKGYRILETDYSTSYGEADIIAEKQRVVVFVEVKSRSSLSYGNPSEAVTRAKVGKYVMLASDYMRRFASGFNVRFDIIEVLPDGCIGHIENAFDASDASKYKKRR